MGRFLVIFLISCILVTSSCSPVRQPERNSPSLDTCAKIGGMDDDLCYVDSYALISFPQRYCGLLVGTFGYVENNWAGINLYPDESRAKHQWIPGTVKFEEKYATALSKELDRRGSGMYVSLTAIFSCSQHHLHDEMGVGTFNDIASLGIFTFDEDGKFVSQHALKLEP